MTDRELPTPELLRKLLRYEPDTGKLFWLPRDREFFKSDGSFRSWNSQFANRVAFTAIDRDGYNRGAVLQRAYYAHRVIWAMQAGAWPKEQIDHVDQNKLNNKWCNLREASISQNGANKASKPNSSSRYLGVSWNKQTKKWLAQIVKNGERVRLGLFVNEKDAAIAYDRMAILKHGEFASLNFPSA